MFISYKNGKRQQKKLAIIAQVMTEFRISPCKTV